MTPKILLQSPCRGCDNKYAKKDQCMRDCKPLKKFQARASVSISFGSALSGEYTYSSGNGSSSSRKAPHL